MVLVRRRDGDGTQTIPKSVFFSIVRPFAGDKRTLLLCVVVAYVLILVVLSTSGPAPVFRRLPLRLQLLRVLWNFIHLVTGIDLVQHQQDVAVGLASLRAHLAVIFFLFLVLYEAAVILSNMPTGLSAPVSGLTDMELCRWTVFGGGAREKLLLNMVNRGRSSGRLATPQSRTWSTCRSVSECLQQVVTAESVNNPLCALAPIRHVEVGLSWKTTVISEFRQNPYLCNLLEVMDAEDEFYTFGMGWFFADVNFSAPNATAHLATWAQRRQEVNAAIRRGRETHAISRVIGREVGFALPCNSPAKLALAESLYVTVVVLLVSGAISALALFRVYQPVDDAVTAAAEATTEMDVEE